MMEPFGPSQGLLVMRNQWEWSAPSGSFFYLEMIKSPTIPEVKVLVENDIDVFQVMELKPSFTPKELEAHFKIKISESGHEDGPKELIETSYLILKDDELLHAFNHYRNKKKQQERLDSATAFKHGFLWLFLVTTGFIGLIIRKFWWLILLVLLFIIGNS